MLVDDEKMYERLEEGLRSMHMVVHSIVVPFSGKYRVKRIYEFCLT